MFHALLIKQSLKNLDALNGLKILTTKEDGSWTIYKVGLEETAINRLISDIQKNMDESQEWYAHIYNKDGSKLIVVFRNKAFTTDNDSKNWDEVINYGESLNIPREQLDFVPNTFETESN